MKHIIREKTDLYKKTFRISMWLNNQNSEKYWVLPRSGRRINMVWTMCSSKLAVWTHAFLMRFVITWYLVLQCQFKGFLFYFHEQTNLRQLSSFENRRWHQLNTQFIDFHKKSSELYLEYNRGLKSLHANLIISFTERFRIMVNITYDNEIKKE